MKLKSIWFMALLTSIFLLASCGTTSSSSSLPISTTSTSVVASSISTTSETSVISTTSTLASSLASDSQQRVFTLAELALYNGDNGSDAYMAVNGIVYDVTHAAEWNNGWHKGMHLAGTDATAAFADSPHALSILSSLPIVGVLEA